MSTENFEFECEKCGKEFKSEKIYKNHINKDVPCDFICKICNKKFSRRQYYRHVKTCVKDNKELINNNVDARKNSIKTQSENNNSLNTINNQSNNNVVMMTPYGLDHAFMDKDEVIGPARDPIILALKNSKYELAYQKLFEQIHGNDKYPQFHNIFMPHKEKNDIIVFSGKRFKFELLNIMMPDLYTRLRTEMDWLVQTAEGLTDDERDQLRWDIQANWMIIQEERDDNMKRILRNNKEVVEKTVTNNDCYVDIETIAKFDGCDPSKIIQLKDPIKLP